MSSISKALEKARRRQGASTGVETSLGSPNVPSSASAISPERADDDVRSVLKVGRFDAAEEHLVSLLSPESMESEHYQTIRFAVERMHQKDRGLIMGVSSSSAKDGKTLTTLNLAGCLGRDKKSRVLVVDGDLRNPSIGKYLGLSSRGPGLSGALRQAHSSLESITKMHPEYNIAVLPAGEPSTVSYEVLKSPQVESLFRQARLLFDFVCVDMPPLIFPECRLLNEQLDALLIVISSHRTQRSALKRALEGLDSSKVMGIVFNRDTESARRIPSYYYPQRG
jgi:receptor protein-tyrosine kinase/non-specific protein-tyrosine kinase